MGTLVENAQSHVASMVEDLTGDEDFLPFMTVKGRDSDDLAYVGLAMPDNDKEKNDVADVMMTICSLHRAVAVVFVTTSWMVTRRNDIKAALVDNVPPSESPDRVEVVFLHHATADGDSFLSATVTRVNNKVILGEWSSPSLGGVGGRFGDAIHMGMDLGAKLPPDMCDYIDAEMADGKAEELVATWLRALSTARGEVATFKAAAERN